jgi:hypothetical protein
VVPFSISKWVPFRLTKTDLGIERPKLRNGQAIANLNTLIYVLINLRALQRIRQRKAELRSESDPLDSAA